MTIAGVFALIGVVGGFGMLLVMLLVDLLPKHYKILIKFAGFFCILFVSGMLSAAILAEREPPCLQYLRIGVDNDLVCIVREAVKK